MRIPFPLNLSVGTDIIAHNRLLDSYHSGSRLRRLTTRILHPLELIDLSRRFPWWQELNIEGKCVSITQQQVDRYRIHIAGRWAAKEAAKKAWGASLISFKDLRVESLPDASVQIVCQPYHDGKIGTDPAAAALEQTAKLSISHDGDYASAVVIATPLHPQIVADLQMMKEAAAEKVRGPISS